MNPYDAPTSKPEVDGHSTAVQSGMVAAGAIGTYVFYCFSFWFFIAPLIAPTDAPLPGAPTVPDYLIALQCFVCYGAPLGIVYLKYGRQRTGR